MARFEHIAVFLHVATLGRYEEVGAEMLSAVKGSAFFGAISHLEVNVVGEGPFCPPFEDSRLVIKREFSDVRSYEFPSLDAMRSYSCEHENGIVLYLNCLGGRHVGAGWDIRCEWRKLVAFLLIEQFKVCMDVLVNNDICGISWSKCPMPHMTGNNWWAKTEYLRGLPASTEVMENVGFLDSPELNHAFPEEAARVRHLGEFWLGLSPGARVYNMLPLSSTLLPVLSDGAVPWWGLQYVPWETIAKLRYGEATRISSVCIYLIQALRWRIIFALRRLKHRGMRLPTVYN